MGISVEISGELDPELDPEYSGEYSEKYDPDRPFPNLLDKFGPEFDDDADLDTFFMMESVSSRTMRLIGLAYPGHSYPIRKHWPHPSGFLSHLVSDCQ